MKNKSSESRRNFLKASAVGAAGLAILGPSAKKASAVPITAKLIPLPTTPINQDIENLRVAYITDPLCMNTNHHWPGWDGFNNPTPAANTTNAVVSYSAVAADMDKLACALANKNLPADAWNTIFKIPSSKTWPTAKAAMKVNTFSGLFPSVAIVAKLCNVLIGKGMLPANICIYDQGNAGPFANYIGAGKPIPAGVVLGPGTDGTPTQVTLPTIPATPPAFATPTTWTWNATSSINGVDIFINCAVNKGHDRYWEYSGVTMCQKNNKRTIDFGHLGGENNGSGDAQGIYGLVYVNSCDYVVGDIPASYPAKTQLCVVDCMWAGNPGEWQGGVSDGADQRSIVMGTFAGAVDHVATKKIRDLKYHAGAAYPAWNSTLIDKFLTGYGYSAADITTLMTPQTGGGKGIVDAANFAVSVVPQENTHLSRQGIVQITVSGSGIKPVVANFNLAKGETVQSAEIYNLLGRKVRTLAINPGSNHIVWDGLSDAGRAVNSGHYVVRLRGQKVETAGDLLVSR
jgi:hypothetical protein